jgi:hypothetical protein
MVLKYEPLGGCEFSDIFERLQYSSRNHAPPCVHNTMAYVVIPEKKKYK